MVNAIIDIRIKIYRVSGCVNFLLLYSFKAIGGVAAATAAIKNNIHFSFIIIMDEKLF